MFVYFFPKLAEEAFGGVLDILEINNIGEVSHITEWKD